MTAFEFNIDVWLDTIQKMGPSTIRIYASFFASAVIIAFGFRKFFAWLWNYWTN
jgi:hypothetical protein